MECYRYGWKKGEECTVRLDGRGGNDVRLDVWEVRDVGLNVWEVRDVGLGRWMDGR